MMLIPISKPLQRALEALSNETGEPIPQLVADALPWPRHPGPVLIGVHVDYRDYLKLFEMVNERNIH